MSLPPELKTLCFQLSSTPPPDLPRLTPTLLRHVSHCQLPLTSPAGLASQADASASSVLVHKLKTQLSSLLNGKSPEGRFAAAVLIKGVVEVGGWEVLQGVESWVRGLLSILGKPDSPAVKELCIMTLTTIYCMAQQYQTLVREITTPTLPSFVTACLNLISASNKNFLIGSSSLEEDIFQSFAMLVPRHTAIFRPFASQIRLAARPYLAPTSSDGFLASQSLRESARRLVVVVHQTAAKNAGAEEWGRGVRELVKGTHLTADYVFRAVVEDWESTSGYAGVAVDVNQELCGGSATGEDLPLWTGIHAGVERLVGRLEMLAEYFNVETSAPVAMPLGAIMDLVTRALSIAIPAADSSAGYRGARLHPAIDRDERDGLWVGMPQIYIAALQLIDSIALRLEDGFLPLAQEVFDQLAWVFEYGKNSAEFRLIAYRVTAKILLHVGRSFTQVQCEKSFAIIQSCCRDLQGAHLNSDDADVGAGAKPQGVADADAFLRSKLAVPNVHRIHNVQLDVAARDLLPLVLSHLPQKHLSLSVRALVDRTSILTHHKDAMVASILNPTFAANGGILPSILPHLTRDFGHDAVVEILLRPRMPIVASSTTRATANEAVDGMSEDEDMIFHPGTSAQPNTEPMPAAAYQAPFAVPGQAGLGTAVDKPGPQPLAQHSTFSNHQSLMQVPSIGSSVMDSAQTSRVGPQAQALDHPMDQSSDDDSVHLTMQLDTDSEEDN
ncbi:hypothetical protein BUE80_DR008611 [Diplocarpon rosae]|nr:hypothetical protein BUE80_DR008611 [Diplocarpon rosae]